MNLVVLHPQIGDAGARALALFQLHEKAAAVGVDGAEFVEFGIEIGRDHTAIAQIQRRFGRDGALQQGGGFGRQIKLRIDGLQQGAAFERGRLATQCRQALQAVAQRRQFARLGLLQRDARGNALQIGHAAQAATQCRQVAVDQCLQSGVARAGDVGVTRWRLQPVAQQAAARRSLTTVEMGKQRGAVFAAQGLQNLQIPAGHGVQPQTVLGSLNAQIGQQGQRAALGLLGVGQQGGSGGVCRAQGLRAEPVEMRHLQLRAELAQTERGVEMPFRSLGRMGPTRFVRQALVLRPQHLGRRDAGQPVGQGGRFALRQSEAAAGQRHPRQPPFATRRFRRRNGQQNGVALVVEQRLFGERARCDHPHHTAFDQPLGLRRIADLLTDRR